MNILLVDDDRDMLDVTAYALRLEGFEVTLATNGAQALNRVASANPPDLVLLDVKMPKMNGFEVCRKIREDSDVPVIMVTASGDEDNILQGFLRGADDYVVKPFSPRQLSMRIRAVLGRNGYRQYEEVKILKIGDLSLDSESHRVIRGSAVIRFTPIEFRNLYLLACNVGRVVSFDRMVEYAWGYDGGDPSLLKTHISRIRKKLDIPKGQPGYIKVLSGVGYCMERG